MIVYRYILISQRICTVVWNSSLKLSDIIHDLSFQQSYCNSKSFKNSLLSSILFITIFYLFIRIMFSLIYYRLTLMTHKGWCVVKQHTKVSRDCCVALPLDATGLSAVGDCGISWSYSLFLCTNWDCLCVLLKIILKFTLAQKNANNFAPFKHLKLPISIKIPVTITVIV